MSIRTAFAHIGIAIASVFAAGCTRAHDATLDPQPRTSTPIPISMASGVATPGPISLPLRRPTASSTPRPTPTPAIPMSPLFVDGPAGRIYASGPMSDTARLAVYDTRDGRLLEAVPIARDERLLDIDREAQRLYVYRPSFGVRLLDAGALTETGRVALPTPDPADEAVLGYAPVRRLPRLPLVDPASGDIVTFVGMRMRWHDQVTGAEVDVLTVPLDDEDGPITNASFSTDGQLLYLAVADRDLSPGDGDENSGSILVSLDRRTGREIERRNLRATISGWLAWDRSLVVEGDVYKDIGLTNSLWIDGHERRRVTAAGVRWKAFDTRRGRLVGVGGSSSFGDGDPRMLGVADPTSLDVRFRARSESKLPLTAYDAATDAFFGRSAADDRLQRVLAASVAPQVAQPDVPAPRQTVHAWQSVVQADGSASRLLAVTGRLSVTPGAQTPTPTSGGDVWLDAVSRDGGATWTLTDGEWGFGIVAAPRPSNDTAAGGTLFAPSAGVGIVRSTDEGRSWQPAGAGIDALRVMDIDVSPGFARDHTLFATSYTTVPADSDDDPTASAWRSRDGGDRWEAVGRYAALAISPDFARDRTVIAFEHLGPRCFVSTDGGDHWTARGRLRADDDDYPFAGETWIIPADAGRPRIVLTMATGGSTVGGGAHWPESGMQLFRSTDDCATWERVYPTDLSWDEPEYFSFDAELLGETAGTWVIRANRVTGTLLSRDGGMTWQQHHLGDDPRAPVLAVQPGGRVVVGGGRSAGVRTVTLDALVPGPPPGMR